MTLDERLRSAVSGDTLSEEDVKDLMIELSSFLYRYDLPLLKIVDYIDLLAALKLKYSVLHVRELFDFLQMKVNLNIVENMIERIAAEFEEGDYSGVSKLCEILSLPEFYKYGDIWRKGYVLVVKAIAKGVSDELLLKVLHIKRI